MLFEPFSRSQSLPNHRDRNVLQSAALDSLLTFWLNRLDSIASRRDPTEMLRPDNSIGW